MSVERVGEKIRLTPAKFGHQRLKTVLFHVIPLHKKDGKFFLTNKQVVLKFENMRTWVKYDVQQKFGVKKNFACFLVCFVSVTELPL